MRCPYCSTPETKVIDSRLNQSGDLTRRRRECNECGGRFTTYERIEEIMPQLVKKDGRRESFNREKVIAGMTKACQKRPITTQQIESATLRIEKLIQSFGLKEIPSHSVGEMVMRALHDLDKVAYVRFASVYREFKDVDEFVADLSHRQTQTPFEIDRGNLSFPFLEPESSGNT